MAKKTAEKKQHSLLIDYKNVFSDVAGRRVLYDLMNHHYLLNCSFYKAANQQSDPLLLAFREGERNVVLRILTKLKMDPKKFEQLIDEGEQDE